MSSTGKIRRSGNCCTGLLAGRGHKVISGTPEQVADWIETWFREGAADGFNIMPPWLNGGFDIFVDEVVPILKQRGLFREDYEGDTLRDHYGLPRPENIHTTRELQRERA